MSSGSRMRADGGERADRAAQFMPFAALRGYYDLVRRRERVVEERHELTEEEARELNEVASRIRKGVMVEVVHYDHDAYVTTRGVVTRVDETFGVLTVVKRVISFEDIRSMRVITP